MLRTSAAPFGASASRGSLQSRKCVYLLRKTMNFIEFEVGRGGCPGPPGDPVCDAPAAAQVPTHAGRRLRGSSGRLPGHPKANSHTDLWSSSSFRCSPLIRGFLELQIPKVQHFQTHPLTPKLEGVASGGFALPRTSTHTLQRRTPPPLRRAGQRH